MNQAVFISDLHLHPQNDEIHQRFERFVEWAKTNTQEVYILGDFIHVWAGDDLMDDYACKIIKLLQSLYHAGIKVYFMPGNRDFLIGESFLKESHMIALVDPCVIMLDGIRIYLTHGDRYCTSDKAHQFLRFWTRNFWFKPFFLNFPARFRKYLVESVRTYSQQKKDSPRKFYPINTTKLYQEMRTYHVMTCIYGHIHRCGYHVDVHQHLTYQRYILSDWDTNIRVLCYNSLKGLNFYTVD